jgi:hypothetical protein
MTASLDSEAKVRLTAHLPVSSQKSVNFEPSGYSLKQCSFLCGGVYKQKSAGWHRRRLRPGRRQVFGGAGAAHSKGELVHQLASECAAAAFFFRGQKKKKKKKW